MSNARQQNSSFLIKLWMYAAIVLSNSKPDWLTHTDNNVSNNSLSNNVSNMFVAASAAYDNLNLIFINPAENSREKYQEFVDAMKNDDGKIVKKLLKKGITNLDTAYFTLEGVKYDFIQYAIKYKKINVLKCLISEIRPDLDKMKNYLIESLLTDEMKSFNYLIKITKLDKRKFIEQLYQLIKTGLDTNNIATMTVYQSILESNRAPTMFKIMEADHPGIVAQIKNFKEKKSPVKTGAVILMSLAAMFIGLVAYFNRPNNEIKTRLKTQKKKKKKSHNNKINTTPVKTQSTQNINKKSANSIISNPPKTQLELSEHSPKNALPNINFVDTTPNEFILAPQIQVESKNEIPPDARPATPTIDANSTTIITNMLPPINIANNNDTNDIQSPVENKTTTNTAKSDDGWDEINRDIWNYNSDFPNEAEEFPRSNLNI